MEHHAYFYEGPMSSFGSLQKSLRPFWAREFEQFGIGDARELVGLASLKHSGEAVFLIAVASITSEAQQALLKLFEEPQRGIVFLLLVPHGVLLQTLKSRMLEYEPKGVALESLELRRRLDMAKDFLSWPYKKRSEWITGFLKEEEGARDRAREFINGLEAALYKQKTSREVREGLEDIAHFRQYLSDRAPSLKMILEHFAATLPKL